MSEMAAVHFDAKTGRRLDAHQVRGGVTGFASWHRMSEVLRAAGEIRPDEDLLSFQIDDRGLSFRVQRR